MSEWKEYKLGDLADIFDSRRIPLSSMERQLRKGIYPYYGASGIIDYVNEYIFDGDYLLISEDGENLNSRQTPIAFEAKNKFWVNNHAHIIKGRNDYANKLILYYLAQLDLSPYITGAVQPKLSQENLLSITFNLPSNEIEQRAIASILSSLDDKIDLLHRQNKTLEQLAETLFREWFVLEEHEDWEEKSLDQIADYLNGLACQKYPPLDEINKLPVIKIKDIKNGFSSNSDWVTSEVPQKYIIERGDILFSWSGSLEVMIWAYGKGVLNQHLFKVTSVEYPKWLYYFATKLHLADFRVIAESKSTTMGHIQREHLSAAKIKIPNDENILKQMDNTFSPLINKIIINFDQIDSLTKMRDTLLSKLMSGEIRVC